MELRFIGTGAAELWPSVFCGCERCLAAIAERGREVRVGSCMLVDGEFLFDLPPNVALAAIAQGVSLSRVRDLFVTHSHQDHFDPGVLTAVRRDSGDPLRLYCNERLAELLSYYQKFNHFFDPAKLGLELRALKPFEVVRPAGEGFTLRPLAANHSRTGGEQPLIYIFERSGRRLLYACDTGWFPERTWREIERLQYDAVALDCTFHSLRECRDGHLSLRPFLEVKRRFQAEGLLKAGAPFIAQHLAHDHGEAAISEDELKSRLEEHAITVAHDGMRIEL